MLRGREDEEPEVSRRDCFRSTLALAAGSMLASSAAGAAASAKPSGPASRLGVFVSMTGRDPDEALGQVARLGFPYCEVYLNAFPEGLAKKLRDAAQRHEVTITALFSSGPGRQVYDFYEGYQTLGLVPREFRQARVDALKLASDFTRECGIPAFETHCGYIPENPLDPLYGETVEAIRDVAAHCQKNGQTFLYHAGQESPITLLRTIQNVGLENQGVGLDTANLIMYGKGHPIDALDTYGEHLKAVNAKDGFYPTDPKNLGKESPLGEGKVDFPRFLRRLKELGYTAPIIIEREVSGPEFENDLKKAKAYLEAQLAELG